VYAPDNPGTERARGFFNAGNLQVLFEVDVGEILAGINVSESEPSCEQCGSGALSFKVLASVRFSSDGKDTGYVRLFRKGAEFKAVFMTKTVNTQFGYINPLTVQFNKRKVFFERGSG
jgi:hypothetical protein